MGKITEIALPEKKAINLTVSNYDKVAFHPTGKIEILLCFDNFELQAKKGIDQLPPVGSKVYLCSNSFLGVLFGYSRGLDKQQIIENTNVNTKTGNQTTLQ